MKRLLLYLSIAAVMLTLGLLLLYRLQFSSEHRLIIPARPTADTVLTIGLIGDSWVQYGALDTLLPRDLAVQGIQCKVYSSGQGGAKSRTIYRNMFKPDTAAFSSRPVLQQRPRYACVIAGVNDANAQAGASFYSHHMLLIIKALHGLGIMPVIVELPEFGIEEERQSRPWLLRFRADFLCLFTNGGKIDNIRKYREQFTQDLRQSGLEQKVLVVKFDELWRNYEQNRDKYQDPSHLSISGYRILSGKIAEVIAADVRKRGLNSSAPQ